MWTSVGWVLKGGLGDGLATHLMGGQNGIDTVR